MNEILQNGIDRLRVDDPPTYEAIMRLEAMVVRLGGTQGVEDASATLMGPYPFTGTIKPGNAVWVVKGRLTPAYNESGWMGAHALGIAVNVQMQKAYVQTVGIVWAECTEFSGRAPLPQGSTMFVSGSKGRIAKGWPKPGKDVYQMGHVVGDHSTYRVKINLAPMALMRFG